MTAEAAVVGAADETTGQAVVAFVILKAGQSVSADDLINRMKGKIASYKIPRHVIFTEGYPMTSSGKIRKIELRAQAKTLLG
jgi:fatty-acyl-CoA synthase